MTEEQCRASQTACAQRVANDLVSLRREIKSDIEKIREAVQGIDRSVATIRGYLGLNGNAGDVHPHKRDSEADEHLHRRINDVLDATEAVMGHRNKPPMDWRVKIMWTTGSFIAGAIFLKVLDHFATHGGLIK